MENNEIKMTSEEKKIAARKNARQMVTDAIFAVVDTGGQSATVKLEKDRYVVESGEEFEAFYFGEINWHDVGELVVEVEVDCAFLEESVFYKRRDDAIENIAEIEKTLMKLKREIRAE